MLTPKEITINYLKEVERELDEQVERQRKANCRKDTIYYTSYKSLCVTKAIELVEQSEGE